MPVEEPAGEEPQESSELGDEPSIHIPGEADEWTEEVPQKREATGDPELDELWGLSLGELQAILDDERHPLYAKAKQVSAEMTAPLRDLIKSSTAFSNLAKSPGVFSAVNSINLAKYPGLFSAVNSLNLAKYPGLFSAAKSPGLFGAAKSLNLAKYPGLTLMAPGAVDAIKNLRLPITEPITTDLADRLTRPLRHPEMSVRDVAAAMGAEAVDLEQEQLDLAREMAANQKMLLEVASESAQQAAESSAKTLAVAEDTLALGRSTRKAGWFAGWAAVAAAVLALVSIVVTVLHAC